MENQRIHDQRTFRLIRKIAEGGMGSVYEAEQDGVEGFTKIVAIKTILEDLSVDPTFVRMFIGEAKLVADLVHQNIVQIYHLGKFDKTYYISMEYIDGVNVEQFLLRHKKLEMPVPTDLAVYIASRVCRGLEYAHNKRDKDGNLLGVVHRDVSPKNILLSLEGVVKLTDFGIAKAANVMLDQEGSVLMGKLPYMSPEQAEYKPTDGRSDLFSLGIVLLEMLTGIALFDAGNSTTILESVIAKPIPSVKSLRPDIPEEIDRILQKALERDLDRRYPDAGTMAYDLEHFIYHDRFGPTIVTMQEYLASTFPERFRRDSRPTGDGLKRVRDTSAL